MEFVGDSSPSLAKDDVMPKDIVLMLKCLK